MYYKSGFHDPVIKGEDAGLRVRQKSGLDD